MMNDDEANMDDEFDDEMEEMGFGPIDESDVPPENLFDPANMPDFDPDGSIFRGVQLIEASAGTGKTYNIASLVVKAVRENKPIEQILVVTFGEAATKELRDRIRTRLFEAMQKEMAKSDPSPVLRQRLEDAVRGFDEAAIYTIHSFCQRALQENAFESGVLFDFELAPDSQTLTLQAADDFWWRLTEEEGNAVVDVFLQLGLSPEKLVELADRVPRVDGDVKLVPRKSPAKAAQIRKRLRGYLEKAERAFAELAATWVAEEPKIRALDNDIIGWAAIRDMAEWLEGRSVFPRDQVLDVAAKLAVLDAPDFKRRGLTLFGLIVHYQQAYLKTIRSNIEQLRVAVLREWLEFRDVELDRRKRRANALFYDDLLYQLDSALKGPGGDTLAERIRTRYPLALIDEFQDTDITQFNIFESVYNSVEATSQGGEREQGDDAQETGCMFLIGDPKQSIYGFRRADIYSYLNAKKDAATNSTLRTNRRSEAAMVGGVNHLFTFRKNPFIEHGIPFIKVKAHDQVGRLQVGGKTPAALIIRTVERAELDADADKPISKNAFSAHVVEHTSLRIANLLNLGQAGVAVINPPVEASDQTPRKVRPSDVAVLVRSHRQARDMQVALSKLGVAAVLQSQGRIFKAPEAETMLQVLAAIERPFDVARMRTALLSPLFGLTMEDLADMEQNAKRFEAWLQVLQGYREMWSAQGFTTMFTRLLREQRVAPRVLATLRGERRMTNLQHLAELLGRQDAEQRGGPGSLVQWLADQIGQPDRQGEDDRELRLESDAHRVQIVTMHHAKGLEYGIVFVPFAWSVVPDNASNPIGFFFHDKRRHNQATWDLGTPERWRKRHWNRKLEEALAEEVRLLYVALTRAKHSCSVVWGPARYAERSSLCYLLHGRNFPLGTTSDAELKKALDELEKHAGGTIRHGPLRNNRAHHTPSEPEELGLRIAAASRTVGRPFRISSFSALKGDRPHHDFHLPEHDTQSPPPETPEEAGEEMPAFATFPGGTQTGNLVHGIFENIDFDEPAGHAEAIAGQIVKHGFEARDDAPDILAALVRDVLHTPILPDGFKMADLPSSRRLVEMEFFFPLDLATPQALQAFCSVELPRLALEGYMKGFIDLTFEHDGKFFVLDYKSNLLGDTLAHYNEEALAETMAESGYDLQYLIYTVALHRYLTSRLPDYHYETHFGGVLYLFVRAMPKRGVYFARPEKATVLELERVLCGGNA